MNSIGQGMAERVGLFGNNGHLSRSTVRCEHRSMS